MNRFLRSISAVLLTLVLWSTYATPLGAQSAALPQEQETLNLYVGDIFELLPVHTLDNATYTWILTQDRNFVEAGRSKVFRKRLIMPGVYTLYAEISSGDGSKHITRTFTLNYQPRVPGQVPATSGSGATAGSLVRTMPALDTQGRAILPSTTQLLQLEPIDPTLRPIAADLDSTKDNDNDGNSGNDIDTDLTFFQSDATPLYVWIAEPLTMRSITVTAVRPEGAIVQHIGVASEAYAREQGFIQSPIELNVVRTSGRSYSFQATFGALSQPQTPLLYNWEFGDGQQSLLSNPTHEYAADGSYEVRVRVRNLTDGRVIAERTQTVEVSSDGAPPATNDPEDTDTTDEENDASGTSLGSIALFVGVFILSVVIGVGIIIVLSRLRSRGTSLSDTIEAMEQSIMKKDGGAAKDATPTLSIAPPPPKAPAAPEPAQREEDRATSNPLQQKPLKVEEKNAPTWLKSGLSTQPAPQAAPATPPAPAAQKPQSVPPWLQQTPAAPRPAQQSTPAAPAPQPQAPKAPQPPASQPPKPAPATQPTPQPPKPAPAAPRPPAAPAPAPEQTHARATPTPPPAAQQPAPPAGSPPAAQQDAPIAIIRADSLNAGSNDQPPAAPPPAPAA